MRIVLRPAGAAFLLVALVVLFVLAFVTSSKRTASGAATGAAASPGAPASPDGSSLHAPMVAPDAPLLTTSLSTWDLNVQGTDTATRTVVADPSTPNLEKRYVRATITKIDRNTFWNVQYLHTIDSSIPKDARYVIRFIGRSPTRARIDVSFMKNGGDHHTDGGQSITLSPTWKVYSIPFVTSHLYDGGTETSAVLCLHLGYQTGIVDLAAVQIYPAEHLPESK